MKAGYSFPQMFKKTRGRDHYHFNCLQRQMLSAVWATSFKEQLINLESAKEKHSSGYPFSIKSVFVLPSADKGDCKAFSLTP